MPKPPSSTWTKRFWKVDLPPLSWHDTPYGCRSCGEGEKRDDRCSLLRTACDRSFTISEAFELVARMRQLKAAEGRDGRRRKDRPDPVLRPDLALLPLRSP